MLMNSIDYLKKIINGIRLHIQVTDIIQKRFKLTHNLQNGILEAGDKMNLQIIVLFTQHTQNSIKIFQHRLSGGNDIQIDFRKSLMHLLDIK